jgi:hypothetical protein
MIVTDEMRDAALAELVESGMDPDRGVATLAATSLARHRVDAHNPLLTKIVLQVAGLSPAIILKLMFKEQTQ